MCEVQQIFILEPYTGLPLYNTGDDKDLQMTAGVDIQEEYKKELYRICSTQDVKDVLLAR